MCKTAFTCAPSPCATILIATISAHTFFYLFLFAVHNFGHQLRLQIAHIFCFVFSLSLLWLDGDREQVNGFIDAHAIIIITQANQYVDRRSRE